VLLFLAVIALPLAANLAGQDGADAVAENRELAPFPQLDAQWSSISTFGTRLGVWFDDHFGFRSWLVRWYGESRLFGLHVSPSTAVVRGRAGWFFYADDEGMADYAEERPLTASEIANWRAAVVAARDWLRTRGVAYVFVIAPDKNVIYPEDVPSSTGARSRENARARVPADRHPLERPRRIHRLPADHRRGPPAGAGCAAGVDARRIHVDVERAHGDGSRGDDGADARAA
jgi:hypothetical protein